MDLRFIGKLGRTLSGIGKILTDNVSDTFNIATQIMNDDIVITKEIK